MEKYNVYGVGNAIVDIVTEVENDFFEKNNIEKGVMSLVDEKRQLELMEVIDMKKSKISGGGSAGNTLAALNQFGGSSFFSCVVAKDELGKFFLDDMSTLGIDTNLKYELCDPGHTGRCLVMTTPDAHRTMNTFLGANSILGPEHADEIAIRSSRYVYLEGYLVASPMGFEAMKETKKLAEKNKVSIALTFSDPSMVKYFGAQMNDVVRAGVDLLFCNEEEAMIFTGSEDILTARQKLRQFARHFVITQGENGAVIFDGDTYVDIEPYKVKAIDTNGAGDMFSGAFMYAITNGHSYAGAGKLASLASSKVVSQFGPRLQTAQMKQILEQFHS